MKTALQSNLAEPFRTVQNGSFKYLTRPKLAEFLGLTTTQVRRMELTGQISPTVLKKGTSFYSVEDAKKILLERKMKKENGFVEAALHRTFIEKEDTAPLPVSVLSEKAGEVSSRVFDALERGLSVVQIVVTEKLTPAVVEDLERQWQRIQQRIIVSTSALKAMRSLGLEGEWPPENAEGLLDNLKKIAESVKPCDKCGKGLRRVCTQCVQTAISNQRSAVSQNSDQKK